VRSDALAKEMRKGEMGLNINEAPCSGFHPRRS